MTFPQLLTNQIDLLIQNLSDPGMDRDLGVHTARKCCKRVRAGFRLLHDYLPAELVQQENRRFREAARLLSAARDSWVMILSFDSLRLEYPEELSGQGFDEIRKKLVERYESILQHELNDQGLVPGILSSMEEAYATIKRIPTGPEIFDPVVKNMEVTLARGAADKAKAYETLSPEDFHEWRKRVKDLQYQLEYIGELAMKDLSPHILDLDSLSELLGQDHDLAVLGELFAARPDWFGTAEELGKLLKVVHKKRVSLEGEANVLGEKIYKKPGLSAGKVSS